MMKGLIGNRKTKHYVMAAFLLCVFVMNWQGGDVQAGQNTLEQFQAEVSVDDGIVSSEDNLKNVSVSEDGTYVFCVNVRTEKTGLTTGCMVRNEDGETVFFAIGEDMSAESGKLDLKAGTYTVEFQYLTSKKDMENFVKAGGQTSADDMGDYEFEERGTWNIHLEYGFKEAEGHSMAYMLGVICGIAFGMIMFLVLRWGIGKAGGRIGRYRKKGVYDERQMMARGKAYQYAYLTLIGYAATATFLDEFGIPVLMSFCGIWLGVCLSVSVFAVNCILKDAYMSLYENVRGIVMMFSAAALFNIVGGIRIIEERRPLLQNGVLSADCINLVVGVMVIVILIVFCWKAVYNRKREEEDGE